MLLSFSCQNFKSFNKEATLSLVPETRLTELKYSILHQKIGKKTAKALSTAVIYGPNASGKTSMINAMSCLRQIVLKGNIEDNADDLTGDHVSARMNLIPFKFNKEAKPISFDISFVTDGIKFRYTLDFFVGLFLEEKAERFIKKEELSINDHIVFTREKDRVTTLQVKPIIHYLNMGDLINNTEMVQEMMTANISPRTLLLTTDFNSFCSKKIVEMMTKWFTNDFLVINRSNEKKFLPTIPQKEGIALIDQRLNKIAKEAGILGSDFAYAYDPDTNQEKLITVLEKNNNKVVGIDSEQVESVGTLRLIKMMPVILYALSHGSSLIIDELDASLHPTIIMNIVAIFHNDEINKHGAQLIFNTHNPIYLNNRLLRRDEIKFVEKDDNGSSIYALSDFKTNGEISVRKTTDYMKNYFVNRYGAILDIDFSDIIDDIINGENEDGKR